VNKLFGWYWRYPLHRPALWAIFRDREEVLWWYGIFWREWSIGVMVRRPAVVRDTDEAVGL
jgi:hypothetical protein